MSCIQWILYTCIDIISKYGYCVLVVKHTHEAVCVLMRMRVCVCVCTVQVLTCTYMYRPGMLVRNVLSLGNVPR